MKIEILFEFMVDAVYCVRFERLSERMQIGLIGVDFPDKNFIEFMYNLDICLQKMFIRFFSCQ